MILGQEVMTGPFISQLVQQMGLPRGVKHAL